jgi:hypothetical protein
MSTEAWGLDGPYYDDLRPGHRFAPAPAITIGPGACALYQSIVGDPLAISLSSPAGEAVTGVAGGVVNPALALHVSIGQSTVATRRVIANLFYRVLSCAARFRWAPRFHFRRGEPCADLRANPTVHRGMVPQHPHRRSAWRGRPEFERCAPPLPRSSRTARLRRRSRPHRWCSTSPPSGPRRTDALAPPPEHDAGWVIGECARSVARHRHDARAVRLTQNLAQQPRLRLNAAGASCTAATRSPRAGIARRMLPSTATVVAGIRATTSAPCSKTT